MRFILFILFSVCAFLLTLIGYRKYKFTTLYALAIGGIVNANFFRADNYPIDCFGLPFGIDSVIYTLFIFCVFIMFIKENKKEAYFLAISSILAIIISAGLQFVADLLSIGYSNESLKTFLTFFVSALASSIAVIVMLELLDKVRNKINKYLLLVISIFIVSILDSVIYIPLSILISGVYDNFAILLLTSVLGKLIALMCSYLAFFLINLIDKKRGK